MRAAGKISQKSAPWTAHFVRFLGSNKFFSISIGLLVIQAAWIALTARYPQAFDEQVHFGLIQLHAQQWLPFFSHQPQGASAYGAVVRDPSYLYHYLLSFPYRLITLFTHDITIQVILLRFLNIGLLCSALPIFRRVLRFTKAPETLVNLSLFFLVITPMVPLLASQINYDNMVLPLSGLLILTCLRIRQTTRADQPLQLHLLVRLALLSLLGSLVKYAFLPLVFVAFVYVVVIIMRRHPSLKLHVVASLKSAAIILMLVVSAGLFIERYGVNLARYHTPTPECNQVLSIAGCQNYSPWLRNYELAAQYDRPSLGQIADFPVQWVARTVEESLFAIGSGFNGGINLLTNNYGSVDYWTGAALPVTKIITYTILATSVLFGIVRFRALLKYPAIKIFASFILVYTAVLFLQNFTDFIHIGTITAVHGRYMLPILPLLYLMMILAIREGLRLPSFAKHWNQTAKSYTLVLVSLLFVTQGGGIVTYLVRSQPRWFWPQSKGSQQVNQTVQKALKPLVLGDKVN